MREKASTSGFHDEQHYIVAMSSATHQALAKRVIIIITLRFKNPEKYSLSTGTRQFIRSE